MGKDLYPFWLMPETLIAIVSKLPERRGVECIRLTTSEAD